MLTGIILTARMLGETAARGFKPNPKFASLRGCPTSRGFRDVGDGQSNALPFGRDPTFANPANVLREKRSLTIEHIRKLSRRFHVSPEVFF